jgi:adenine phosphoribosyltransferase
MTGARLSLGELKALVRTVPDFPASGIQFRDITTLIADSRGLASAVAHLADHAAAAGAAAIAGIDARGFIFGAAVASRLGLGFIPLRKAGKLPVPTLSIDYALEYGVASLELDASVIDSGARIVVMDDLLATGGTALAGVALLRQAGAVVDRALFAIDLPDLGGAETLRNAGVEPVSLIQFSGH